MFDWQEVTTKAGDHGDVSPLLSAVSAEIILEVMQYALERWRWGGVDDADWNEIDDAVSSAISEVIEGF